jgi:PIN domain nuclease of toxin-antitoxin system
LVLLDTCALLWLASDQSQLSEDAKNAVRKNAGALFVSAITALEIAIKCRRGKLTLPLPVLEWFVMALDSHGIKEIPVTGSIAVASVALPHRHNDPFDRIIVATAELNGMKIISCDQQLAQYEQVKVIW